MMQGYRSVGPAVGYQADDWSRETAEQMIEQNYEIDAIIRVLEAYGLSSFAVQALVRKLQDEAAMNDFNYVGSRHHY